MGERKADQKWDQTLYEFIPTICLTLDPSGVVINVNQYGAARLGYRAEQLISKSIVEILDSEDQQQLPLLDTRNWQNLDQVVTWESRLVCANSQIIWVKASARAVPALSDSEEGKNNDFNHQPSSVILVVCEDITQTKQTEQQQREREKRLSRQTYTLTEFAKSQILNRSDLKEILQKITKTAADALEVERVGIWLYQANHTQMICLDLYEAQAEHHSEGMVVETSNYPCSFQALEKQTTIVVEHVCSDLRIKELSDAYLSNLGITAFLQIPIALQGQVVGIVCYEHITSNASGKECQRQWLLDEEDFARTCAELITLALEVDRRGPAQTQPKEWEPLQFSPYNEPLQNEVEISNLKIVPAAIIQKTLDEHTAELRRLNEQLHREIASRAVAEEALKREQTLFIEGPVTVFRWLATENWPIEYVSPNISQFGYQASQCNNGQVFYANLIYPNDLERVSAEVRAYSNAGATSFEQDYRIVQGNGESRWVYDFTVVVRNQEGKVTYYEGYILDITERKKNEAALRESEEQLRRFYEASFEAIAIIDQEKIVDVNRNFTELFGYQSSEVIGMSVMKFVAPAFHPLMKEMMALGVEKTYESVCVKKNGSVFPVEIRGKAITYQGRVVRVSAMRDLSDRKQAEAERDRSLSLLHATLESTADGIVAINTLGEIISFNRKFVQMWGIPEEFMVSPNSTRLLNFAIEQLQDPEAFLRRIRELPNQVDGELYDVLALKDGRIFERYSLPQRADEKIIGRVWSFRDITERQRTEASLLESERRFRAIFNSSFQFIGLMNPDGTLLEANQTALNFGGLTSADVIAQPFWECRWWVQNHQPAEDVLEKPALPLNSTQERLKAAISQAATGQVVRYEVEMLGVGDKVATMDFSIKPVFDQAGEVVLLISEGHDITERKYSEIALRQQAERERLLGAIAQRIRQSLNLEETLNTTVAEVRQLLQADRVIIFRFESNYDGVVAVESVTADWPAILATNIHDPCFAPTYVKLYKQGRIRATDNIYTANMSQCHVNLLAQFQVHANLVVPILQSEQTLQNSLTQTGSKLWGLLIAHQCSGPRQWQTWEGELLMQLTEQVAIAIQQAQLYQQLQAANRELELLASSDGLTRLANRRRFDTYLEQEVERLAQGCAPISLILCDIDCFKPYNDTYGHQAGDACLQEVAGAIRNALKGATDLAARYGGEEFAVILPDTDAIGALQVAEAICAGVHALQIPHAKSAAASVVTLSLGVASALAENTTPAQLIAAADEALYQAKEGGRDQVVVNNRE